MGGRGGSSGISADNGKSFEPTRSNELTDKLGGKTLSLSTNTITIKGENGKTAGMERDISRVNTLSRNDQEMLHSFRQKTGIDLRQFGTENIYKKDGDLYLFNNTKADYTYSKLKLVNPTVYKGFVERKMQLKKIEDAGVYVVNYIKY